MKKPYIIWNAFEEMVCWPDSFATVAEALKMAEAKKEMYRIQGFYSAEMGRIRIPFAGLKVGVLWDDLASAEADSLMFYVADTRKKGGFVSRGSL